MKREGERMIEKRSVTEIIGVQEEETNLVGIAVHLSCLREHPTDLKY